MFIITSVISRRKAKEAVATSVVKISGRDVLASWKILIALGVTPILYTLYYALLATVVAVKAKIRLFNGALRHPFVVAAALPFINYAALKFGEAGIDILNAPSDYCSDPWPTRLLGQDQEDALTPVKRSGRWYLTRDFLDGVAALNMKPPSGQVFLAMKQVAWSALPPDGSDEEDNGDYDNVVGILSTNEELYVKVREVARIHALICNDFDTVLLPRFHQHNTHT